MDDATEATRSALDGRQAEMWTALPGIIQSFDPVAMTVVVQPAIKGRIQDEAGAGKDVNLPLLVDVPVVFPCGGGFSLTNPIKPDDECLVILSSRCIDGWWQSGGIGGVPDERMHDLSDAIALVGPRSQPRRLDPAVDADNVQLRTDDGQAHITMMPDYTILALNPECSVQLDPDGTITARNKAASVTLTPGGEISLQADSKIVLDAPLIVFRAAAFTMESQSGGGGKPTATINANIDQDGWHTSTGDQVAGGVSQISHPHSDAGGSGNSGPPIAGG
jgi:hypothetical protein